MSSSDDTLSRYPLSGLFFDSLPLGIVIHDTAGKIVTANPAAERILGLSLEQMRGVTSLDPRWHSVREDGSLLPGLEHPAMVALRTGQAVSHTLMSVFNPKLGDQTWINVSAVPIMNDVTGTINGAYAVFEDVTERRRVEAALEASKAELDEAQRVANMGSWYWGIKTGEDVFSDGLLRVFGRETIPPFEQQSGVIYSPETWRILNDAVQEAVRTGIGYNLDLQALRGDGKPIWINTRCQPERNASAEIVGLRGTVQDITERKEKDQALIASEQRLRQSQFIAKLGDFECALESGKVMWSEGMYRLLGYNSNEAIDLSMINAKIHHPDDLPRITKWLQDAYASDADTLCPNEYRLIRKDGTVIYVRAEGLLVRQDGKVTKLFGTCADITEGKKTEVDLRASQEQFRIAQQMSPDGFTILRPVRDDQERIVDFTWVYENAAIARLNGTDPEAVVGRRLLELFPGHRGTPILKAYQQVAETGEACILESDYSGESISNPTSFRLVVVPMAGNIAILAQDITERKQGEDQLKKLSQRLLLATSSAQLAVWDWNVRENTMEWDARMFELYGITREIFPNTIETWTNGLHPEDKETAIAECQAALRGEKDFDTVFRVLHPNGTVKYLKANAIVIQGADGTASRMLGINADITERKQLELALTQSKEELQGLARSVLDVREEERRRIARELHDDLGHHLTSISIDIEKLEAKLLPTELETKAGLSAILDQVYQVVDANRRICEDLRPGLLDALGLPAAIESHVKSFAERTGLNCELVMSHNDFAVDGNVAINIFRIVQESLNNAAKYSKALNVLVTMQFSAHKISLIVEDNGIGLAARGKDGHIGFGLLGMRERVSTLNGQLSISSEPGRGVRIEAVIPT